MWWTKAHTHAPHEKKTRKIYSFNDDDAIVESVFDSSLKILWVSYAMKSVKCSNNHWLKLNRMRIARMEARNSEQKQTWKQFLRTDINSSRRRVKHMKHTQIYGCCEEGNEQRRRVWDANNWFESKKSIAPNSIYAKWKT